MTPDDLTTVDRSWSELRRRRAPLLAALTLRYDASTPSRTDAAVRAAWVLRAVEELVDLLSAPSRLAERASALGETWPDPCTAPCFAVDGRLWLAAARDCVPTWSYRTDAAWKQAWLLLSETLAVEALSPFTDP